MTRLLVCGDRNWDDELIINRILNGFMEEAMVSFGDLTIIEGCAKGADWVAHCFLNAHCNRATMDFVLHEHYPAQWEALGKAAGPSRNQRMIDKGKPDLVLAFHDRIFESKGTRDMISRAETANIPVYLISRWGEARSI